MLNLTDLQVFLAAARWKNYSRAARYLNLTQPAVSQRIAALEGRFGCKLFRRQGRAMMLTDAGQVLEPMARELLVLARRLDETMVSLQGQVIGEMVLGCSTASGKYLLPRLIARFRNRYPQVRVNVEVNTRAQVLKKLGCGEVAFGISSKKIEQRDIEYRLFFTDDVILIVSAGHPWAAYPFVKPDDLLDQPFILREPTAGTREVFFRALQQHDLHPEMLNVVMELGNAEAIEMAVEEGIGVAFISRTAAQRGLDLGKIVEVQVEGMDLKREIFILRNTAIPPTRAQLAFWEFVASDKARQCLSPAGRAEVPVS